LLYFVVLAVAVPITAVAWHRLFAQRRARERLFANDDREQAIAWDESRPGTRPYVRRYRFVPWLAGAAVAAGFWWLANLAAVYAVTFGIIAALLAGQLESYLYSRKNLLLEMQLADAIDLIIGALGAGAGATAGLEAALRESRRPLRPLLEDLLGRIRYGDDPADVVEALAERVPLETFLLFTSALAVHWEVGGSLAPTLAMVGRTIRDRVETSRRIRSSSLEAQFSIVVILAVTYLIAAVMWRTNPGQMREFLNSPLASWFIAGSMLLQAVGMVWSAALSKLKF